MLDDQVWAYRVGEVTTVANLSDQAVTRQLTGDDTSACWSPRPRSAPRGPTVDGELSLGPWETVVLAAQP